jgi:serine/threonine protein phosphatase PrpC
MNLKDILVQSVKDTKSIGTSTFVATLLHEKEPILYGLNLGDSGYILVRDNHVYFQTEV